ncbi:MAG: PQQ-binding-like beta-propeller repeat protein, partial [Marinilabiliaceae bacterium]|nr:PQQ-binding-like beta-propeller repeat protein [Marinilabiliaceae bacterium]
MKSLKNSVVIGLGMLLFACNTPVDQGKSTDTWHSYMHDQQNTGVSGEELTFPLQLTWERAFQNPPQPAWPAPAKQDYYNGKRKLEPLVTYDRVFQPVVVGNRLFLASSANNSIACYDVLNGELIWKFYSGAPNRVAPLWYKGKLFVGSDDGHIYCLNAENGELQWKRSFGGDRKMMGNGRIISSVPVRTGIVAKGDTIFVAAGLLPEENVSVNACKASTGDVIWSRQLTELAPQGYPVLMDSLWYVPNSRVQPMVFSTRNGELSHRLKGDGGDNVSVIDGRIVSGVDWKGELNAKRLLES